jgi:hypothetical protein
VYLDQAWQNAFCFGLAVEKSERDYMDPTLLLTIVGGNDSTLQAMKAAIDIGSHGLSFGHGIKQITDYKFHKEFGFKTERGKYDKFPNFNPSFRKKGILLR